MNSVVDKIILSCISSRLSKFYHKKTPQKPIGLNHGSETSHVVTLWKKINVSTLFFHSLSLWRNIFLGHSASLIIRFGHYENWLQSLQTFLRARCVTVTLQWQCLLSHSGMTVLPTQYVKVLHCARVPLSKQWSVNGETSLVWNVWNVWKWRDLMALWTWNYHKWLL